ncbi:MULTISPECIES: hypothetical protein [Planktothrix]|nr:MULTISPECIES: hypothetical protein [Planktothrix]
MPLVVLLIGINLIISFPALAEDSPSVIGSSEALEVGQKVIWLYKVRADSTDIHKIPAEVVKLGSKQVQIKFRKNSNKFINRWVNRNRIESFPSVQNPDPDKNTD